MSRWQAVVFDLDDTLYPEREYVHSGFKAVAEWVEVHLGVSRDVVFKEFLQLFSEGKRGNIFDLWLSSRGIEPGPWVTQMVAVYRGHHPQIKPYQDTLEVLPRLRRSYRLGLVTDGYAHVQRRKLEALGVTSYFDAVVFTDALGEEARKPSIRPFGVILEYLELTGPEAVYVADNPCKDFLGARSVGMWTIRVRRINGLYSHLVPPSAEYAPHMEITNLNDLENRLVQIGGSKGG